MPASAPRTVAVVSGGARGIGAAIVDCLLLDGWTVVAVDVNARAMDGLRRRAEDSEGRLEAREFSIVDRAIVEATASDLIARYGTIDALVNNAGMTLPSTFLTQTDADWDRIVDVNLKGTFVMSQVFAREMVNQGSGSIVNISSISAHGIRTGPPAYAAAKAGVEGLGRLMAVQLGPSGVRTNTVVVGTTATPGLIARKSEDDLREMESSTLMGRLGQPADVAHLVAFLCSPNAAHLTGQLISVSGGQWVP
jgi:NAD(P)-dependent dehydrogenase (short-subunit alcohol dehydrogenase family)